MPSDEMICGNCPHTYYDHGGWLGDRRAEVEKVRQIGCRIAICGCSAFHVGVPDYGNWAPDYSEYFMNGGWRK